MDRLQYTHTVKETNHTTSLVLIAKISNWWDWVGGWGLKVTVYPLIFPCSVKKVIVCETPHSYMNFSNKELFKVRSIILHRSFSGNNDHPNNKRCLLNRIKKWKEQKQAKAATYITTLIFRCCRLVPAKTGITITVFFDKFLATWSFQNPQNNSNIFLKGLFILQNDLTFPVP